MGQVSTTPTTVVLFGATGDLVPAQAGPGLLHLFQSGLLNEIRVVGTSLDPHDRESFLEFVRASLAEHANKQATADGLSEFCERVYWAPGEGGATALRKAVEEAEEGLGRRAPSAAALPQRAAPGGAVRGPPTA